MDQQVLCEVLGDEGTSRVSLGCKDGKATSLGMTYP